MTRENNELSEESKLFQQVYTEGPMGIAICDPHFHFTRANAAFCRMMGYTEQELAPLTFRDITHPEHIERDAAHVGALARDEISVYRTEKRYVKKSKEVFWATVTVSTLRNPNGQLEHYVIMAEDITETKLAQWALQESEEKFRNLSDQSPNMIFINKGGRVVYANIRCEEIMGYSQQEFCSSDFDFMKLVAPDYHTATREHFQKHMRGDDIPSYEYMLVTKSGTRIPAVISTKLIQYEGVLSILGIVTDISELKHAETSLKKAAVELQEQKKALEAKNAALKEILAQIESEKLDIKRRVTANAEKLLLPLLHKMKRRADPADRRRLDVLESNVRDLTSKFGAQLSGGATALSAREMEISNMVKSGLSSKEIAQLLQVSLRTVDTYRNRIRKKLGISNQSVNLSTHLRTLV